MFILLTDLLAREVESRIFTVNGKPFNKSVNIRFFMSKSNLIRVFKKHTGQTPYKFLLDEKIRISKVLLRSTNMNVKTIADRLCFSDEHYFSFIFKRKTGCTPLKYRNGEID